MSEVAGLLRALARAARTAGVNAAFTSEAAEPWASATYVGMRHLIAVHAPDGPVRTRWLAGLPEAEVAVPGHLVADLAVVEGEDGHATLSVLKLVAG